MSQLLPDEEVAKLKKFVSVLQANPELLWEPKLAFFKDFLESLGATLPKKKQESKVGS